MNTIIPPNSILITLDVWSLYTNIPQDEGTQICLTALKDIVQAICQHHNFYENPQFRDWSVYLVALLEREKEIWISEMQDNNDIWKESLLFDHENLKTRE